MKRIVFLIGLILVTSTTFAYSDQAGNPQNIEAKSSEVRVDKIKAFVDGFENYAKKILDGYKKEIEGVEAKVKVEKHNQMLGQITEYFADRDFNRQEWLIVQQEFERRYKISKADYDELGSEITRSMVRRDLKKTAVPDFDGLLAIISNKNYDAELRTKYVSDMTMLIHEASYYPNEKYKSVDTETKNKIVDALIAIINDKTNDFALRKESAYLLAGYFGENEKAVNAILSLLNDPTENDEMKSRIIFVAGIKFGVAKDRRILEKLIYISKNKDDYSTEIVNKTIRTLSYLNNKDAINVGVNILDTTNDEKLFLETLASLSKTNDKEAIKAILRNNSKFGIYTINSFYQNDEILIDIMNNESKEYTLPAIEALGANIAKDSLNVVKQLETKMYDADPKIKLASIRAIRKRGKHGSIELKREILAAFNKVKIEEKNREVLEEIENSIKMLESN